MVAQELGCVASSDYDYHALASDGEQDGSVGRQSGFLDAPIKSSRVKPECVELREVVVSSGDSEFYEGSDLDQQIAVDKIIKQNKNEESVSELENPVREQHTARRGNGYMQVVERRTTTQSPSEETCQNKRLRGVQPASGESDHETKTKKSPGRKPRHKNRKSDSERSSPVSRGEKRSGLVRESVRDGEIKRLPALEDLNPEECRISIFLLLRKGLPFEYVEAPLSYPSADRIIYNGVSYRELGDQEFGVERTSDPCVLKCNTSRDVTSCLNWKRYANLKVSIFKKLSLTLQNGRGSFNRDAMCRYIENELTREHIYPTQRIRADYLSFITTSNLANGYLKTVQQSALGDFTFMRARFEQFLSTKFYSPNFKRECSAKLQRYCEFKDYCAFEGKPVVHWRWFYPYLIFALVVFFVLFNYYATVAWLKGPVNSLLIVILSTLVYYFWFYHTGFDDLSPFLPLFLEFESVSPVKITYASVIYSSSCSIDIPKPKIRSGGHIVCKHKVCKPKQYPLLGIGIENSNLVIPTCCSHDLESAIRIRYLFDNSFDNSTMKEFMKFYKLFCRDRHVGRVEQKPFAEWWLNLQPGRRIVLENLVAESHNDKLWTREIFCKKEAYLGKTESSWKPRLICKMNDNLQAGVYPLCAAFTEHLKMKFCIFSSDFFDCATPADELGMHVGLMSAYGGGVLYDIDVRSFDGSLVHQVLKCEQYVLRRSGFKYGVLGVLVRRWAETVGESRDVKFKCGWGRRSGDDLTTCFNSLCSIIVFRFVCKCMKLDSMVMARGDDCVASMFQSDFDIEEFKMWYRKLGLEVTIGRQTIDTVEYCSGRFWAQDDGTYVWGNKPGRVLSKFGLQLSNHLDLRGVVLTMKNTGSYVPVLGDILKALEPNDKVGSIAESWKTTKPSEDLDICEASLVQFCSVYGVSRDDLDAFRRGLRNIKYEDCPMLLVGRVADAMYVTDVGGSPAVPAINRETTFCSQFAMNPDCTEFMVNCVAAPLGEEFFRSLLLPLMTLFYIVWESYNYGHFGTMIPHLCFAALHYLFDDWYVPAAAHAMFNIYVYMERRSLFSHSSRAH